MSVFLYVGMSLSNLCLCVYIFVDVIEVVLKVIMEVLILLLFLMD